MKPETRYFILVANEETWLTALAYNMWGFKERTKGLWNTSNVGDYVAFYVTSYAGRDYFTKANLTHDLPPEIVGNRQPIKALTEYLCRENFLVRLSESNFRRLGKVHVFEVVPQTDLAPYIEIDSVPNDSIKEGRGMGYAYTDEFGLYPIL